ncbi:hypothetical protein MBAV_006323 [Candidatus Magnetobacterium bavaricum]|uniref:Uncharacterized protein n=1 Tax=Candidatus Magnetobacterium bavaricum TaxID=29290 RepID=A0A0F3GHQ8_9BACT|nr:hypothetical protein MBAV_006323 [Candidatus Magnetobacterium bavaricum]
MDICKSQIRQPTSRYIRRRQLTYRNKYLQPSVHFLYTPLFYLFYRIIFTALFSTTLHPPSR